MTFDRVVGAFVFPEAWNDLSRFRSLLSALREYGVNTILTESVTYEADAINAAHDLGLSFYAGIACFSDHARNFDELARRPELWPIIETGELRPQMEWYVGISPTDRTHQGKVLATISSIAAAFPIDGLFLDFVRWPLHWEIELRRGRPRPPDSSFDETTLTRFAETLGLELPPHLSSASARAAWIRALHLREWVDFKCRVVTDFVGQARSFLKANRPDAELGIYVVPDVDGLTEPLTGQRISDLAPLADRISPMLYHNILLQPPTWIGEKLSEIVRVAGRKTLPVVQADSNRDPAVAADWGPPMSVADWRATLVEVGARSDIGGLVVFPGTSLLHNDRGEVLRTTMSRPM